MLLPEHCVENTTQLCSLRSAQATTCTLSVFSTSTTLALAACWTYSCCFFSPLMQKKTRKHSGDTV